MSLFSIPAFDHYWKMWNEPDSALVRTHLDRAVTEDFIFCDPLHFHAGRDALEENVHEFRREHKHAVFVMASGVDTHHNRYRYRWDFTVREKVYLKGFDVSTVAASGLIERIDGFFGDLPSLGAH